jgi:hypothetical protein
MFKRTYLSLLVSALLPLSAMSATVDMPASGKTEDIAVKKAGLSAVRAAMIEIKGEKFLQEHTKEIRNKVILKIDDFVTGTQVVSSEQNEKGMVQIYARVDYDRDKLTSVLNEIGGDSGVQTAAKLPSDFKVVETNHDDEITFEGTLNSVDDKVKCKVQIEFASASDTYATEKDIRRTITKELSKELGKPCEFLGKNTYTYTELGVVRYDFVINLRVVEWGQKFLCKTDPLMMVSVMTNNSNMYYNSVLFTDCQYNELTNSNHEEIVKKLFKDNGRLIFQELTSYWDNED